MFDQYTVYWIHLEEDKCPFTQGYVGITKQKLKIRFRQHKRHKQLTDNYIIIPLHKYLSKEDALKIEEYYRPERNIGLNREKGGIEYLQNAAEWKPDKITKEKISKTLKEYGEKGTHSSQRQDVKTLISIGISGKNHGNYGKKGKDTTAFGYKHTDDHKQYMSKRMIGGNNSSAKSIIFRDKFYSCIQDAVNETNISRYLILKEIKKGGINPP